MKTPDRLIPSYNRTLRFTRSAPNENFFCSRNAATRIASEELVHTEARREVTKTKYAAGP